MSPSVPGRGKGGWPQGPPVQNGTESQLEGWGLPPAPASSPRQPRRLWARRTHQGSNRSLPRPWPPPTPRREQLLVISQVSTRQRRELGGTTRPRAQPCGQINGRPGSQGPDSANCPSGALVPPRGPPPQPTPALESAPQLCGKCGRPRRPQRRFLPLLLIHGLVPLAQPRSSQFSDCPHMHGHSMRRVTLLASGLVPGLPQNPTPQDLPWTRSGAGGVVWQLLDPGQRGPCFKRWPPLLQGRQALAGRGGIQQGLVQATWSLLPWGLPRLLSLCS